MPQQNPDTDPDAFVNVETPDTIEDAIADPDVPTGRGKRGWRTEVGLFGGYRSTDDPTELRPKDDETPDNGIPYLKTIRELIADTEYDEDTISDITFPSRMTRQSRVHRADLDNPFTAYQSHIYVKPGTHYGAIPSGAIDGFYEHIAAELDDSGTSAIHAIELSLSKYTLGEMFRTVFPWAKHGELTADRETELDHPSPVDDFIAALWRHPQLPDYHVLTVTVHSKSKRYEKRYDSAPDEFHDEFFRGGDFQHIVDADPRDDVAKELNAADASTERHSITYTLSLTLDTARADAAIESDQHYHVHDREDYARMLARKHHEREYGEERGLKVAIQSIEESDDSDEMTVDVLIAT